MAGWVGVAGWLDQVRIKLSQLSTKLRLKWKLSLAILRDMLGRSSDCKKLRLNERLIVSKGRTVKDYHTRGSHH